MKRILCFFIGHAYSEIAGQHGYLACDRCGFSEPLQEGRKEPFTIAEWLHWRRYVAKRKVGELKAWLSPCSDCGKRFGRHNNTIDHLPF